MVSLPGAKAGSAEAWGAAPTAELVFVTFYVEVDDPTAYLEEVERMGGKVIVPPTEIPAFNLTFAYFADPEGHVVGLSRGAVQ